MEHGTAKCPKSADIFNDHELLAAFLRPKMCPTTSRCYVCHQNTQYGST